MSLLLCVMMLIGALSSNKVAGGEDYSNLHYSKRLYYLLRLF